MKVALVSHCNFLGNSAMHVFSMAEELQNIGHDVVVLVPDGVETVERHRPPNFPIVLYQDAIESDLPFTEGGKAQIIHCWTPREHVRKITEVLALKEGCAYILHMEDNEEQILTDELKNLDFRQVAELPMQYQDLLVNNYRSHPTHYRQFADRAAGFTCLIDRLLEFKPKHVPGAVFWAGFDREFENLRTDVRGIRSRYAIAEDDVLIFFSGNVHHSIAGDVRNLYLAVAALRARGRRVRLLRTGWNHAALDLPWEVRHGDAFIELGFVDRAEVPALLAISDLLVQPGRSDPFNDYRFPSKLPEYLVSGKPVILPACNIGNALKDGEDVIKLYDGSFTELLGAIERVLDDQRLAAKLGAASKRFALDNLKWSRSAKIASDFYEQVFAKPLVQVDCATAKPAKPLNSPEMPHPVNLIAFYLPQFHPIPENDEWWGKGFTEWTNVVRAKPKMFNHRQPRLPADLGFYDLRAVETMHAQARLAKEYGLGGFCFYVYWFEGRRLLERPVDLWVEKGPDFPFCICWANENWSRRWDGSDSEILISQEYAAGFEERFIIDFLPVLTDPRYIRVNNAPILPIYRITEFPDPVASIKAFRLAAAKHGIPEIHVAMMQSFGLSDPRPYGCDAAIEFSPPHTNRLLLDPHSIDGVYSDFAGHIEDYVGVATQSINALPTDYVRYRGCFPMWDNTARRKNRGHVFVNDAPKAYARWLRFLVEEAMTRRERVKPMVFINAWNEWAEGAYLEPDENYGHALLEVTRAALVHGVADYAQGGSSPDRERQFTYFVSRLPKL
jgi:glycosyltransferase involved in cell wall biosynthesis